MRAWASLLGLLCLLGCRERNPGQQDRLQLGPVRQRLGDEALGIEIRPYHQGRESGQAWIAHVAPKRARLRVVPATAGPRPLPDLVSSAHPAGDHIAINGGFYDNQGAMGLVLSGGRVIHPVRRGGGSGVFYVAEGRPVITHRSGLPDLQKIQEAVQSIDRLAEGGQPVVRGRPDLPHDARSGVALDANGGLMLVVLFDQRAVEEEQGGRIRLGHRTTTTGPTLYDFAELLVRPVSQGGLGAVSALNLDGGYSTAMRASLGGIQLELLGYRETINAVVAEPAAP